MRVCLIFLLLLIAGCAWGPYGLHTKDCQIFYTEPDRQYTIVGTFTVRGDDYSYIVKSLQRKVLIAGGDALIVKKEGKSVEGSIFSGQGDENFHIVALGIKLK